MSKYRNDRSGDSNGVRRAGSVINLDGANFALGMVTDEVLGTLYGQQYADT